MPRKFTVINSVDLTSAGTLDEFVQPCQWGASSVEISEKLIEAKEAAQIEILEKPGVNGVGIGVFQQEGELAEDDEPALRVYVDDLSQPPEELPDVGGLRVCLIEEDLEPLSPIGTASPNMTRYEELKGGCRIKHTLHGAGTMGAVVKESEGDDPTYFGLTAQHVVGTGLNSSGEPETVPHPIYQAEEPQFGSTDEKDAVGLVYNSAYPATPSGGLVEIGSCDAAIFTFDLTPAQRGISAAIIGEEPETELTEAVTGSSGPGIPQLATKSGFASGVTQGIVVDWHKLTWWKPGGNPRTYLGEQFVVLGSVTAANPSGVFAVPGDSGSLVLEDGTSTAIGLVYGGNAKLAFLGEYREATCSRIRNVELALGVTPVL
jgi:hypothetical protein